MPAISSDTLFHFTNKVNLLGILTEEFHPHFCLEEYRFGESSAFKIGIPMVCFCDIPLSLVGNHMVRYGRYGIGMSKEWATRNKLNPVLYLHGYSEVTDLFNRILNSIAQDISEIQKQGMTSESLTDRRDMLFKVFRFTKPFDDWITRKGESVRTKFYDEREWRYVPDPKAYGGKLLMMLENEYKDPLLSEQNQLLKTARLRFEPSDINYLIIQDEEERLDLIQGIRRIKRRYDGNTKDVLTSKIITAAQMLSDF